MYNPYLPKTILRIQTALVSETLPLPEHLRVSLVGAEHLMKQGLMMDDGDMWTRGYYSALELAEQIAMLNCVLAGQR